MHHHPAVLEAIAAFERGDLARARALVDQRLGEKDESPLLHHVAGLIACRMGYGERGVEWLRRAFLAEPDNAKFRLILAKALIDTGRPIEALEIVPLPAQTQRGDLEILTVRAEAAFKAHRRDLESEAWAAFCAVRGDEPLALINLARSFLAQNRFDEAESAYREALAFVPTHGPAIHELALTLERTNQIDALKLLLDEALERGVAKSVLAEAWALLELRRGRPEEASELLANPPSNAGHGRGGSGMRTDRLRTARRQNCPFTDTGWPEWFSGHGNFCEQMVRISVSRAKRTDGSLKNKDFFELAQPLLCRGHGPGGRVQQNRQGINHVYHRIRT